MKRIILLLALTLFIPKLYGQYMSRLDKELFSRDMKDVAQILRKKLAKGDSSQLSQYAYALHRLHNYNDAFKHYHIAAEHNQLNEIVYVMDYFRLAKQHKIPASDYQWCVDRLKAEGYQSLTRKKTNYFFSQVKNVCYNSSGDDLGLTPYGDKFIYSSTQKTMNENIENSLLRTFMLSDTCASSLLIKDNNEILNPVLNTKNHIGPIHVSKDGKFVFVTRSQSKPTTDNIYNLEIVYTIKGTASNTFQVLPGCDMSYSTQHPYFDEKNQLLYFSSNRPGGKGGFDIYTMKFDQIKNNWLTPEPLVGINSAANEVFPTLDGNSNLYYSTEALNGYGGLDIVAHNLKTNESFLLDQPINSLFDDFYILHEHALSGSFCSNRNNGKGGDDIYTFSIDTTPYKITLMVKDSVTGKTVANAAVKFNVTQATYETDSNGNLLLIFPVSMHGSKSNFIFDISKSGYYGKTITEMVVLHDVKTIMIHTILSPIPIKPIAKIKVGQDLGKLLNLNPIYFDLAKWDIRPDAAVELDKIVKAMQEMPTLVIELGSHTDSRASAKYNQTLSQQRAESSAKYIISKGIDPSRLTWKGYGESKLLNKCKDGVKCSEADHSKNRRTEFRIVKM